MNSYFQLSALTTDTFVRLCSLLASEELIADDHLFLLRTEDKKVRGICCFAVYLMFK